MTGETSDGGKSKGGSKNIKVAVALAIVVLAAGLGAVAYVYGPGGLAYHGARVYTTSATYTFTFTDTSTIIGASSTTTETQTVTQLSTYVETYTSVASQSTGNPTYAGAPAYMEATCSSLPKNTTTPVEHVVTGGNASHVYILIVEADPPSPYAGINGSYYTSPLNQWPTIQVKVGQVVSFHVINCASSEAHGFEVSYYADINKGLVSISPGQTYDVTFTATKAGTFRIYCGIFCGIHPLMQNGALVVTA